MIHRLVSGSGMEFRRAARRLRRAPGFSLGVIVILGLAVGGAVTVGATAYDLFIKPLPFRDPDRLVQIEAISERFGGDMGLSPGIIQEIRNSGDYAGVAAYTRGEIVHDETGQSWKRARIGVDLLELLGVTPIHGRGFVPEEGMPGAAPVALLSERVWRDRIGADPEVLNRTIDLEDQIVRIVGIMPGGFTVPSRDTDLWMPLVFKPQAYAPEFFLYFGGYSVIGRMRPGRFPAAYQEQLRARYADPVARTARGPHFTDGGIAV